MTSLADGGTTDGTGGQRRGRRHRGQHHRPHRPTPSLDGAALIATLRRRDRRGDRARRPVRARSPPPRSRARRPRAAAVAAAGSLSVNKITAATTADLRGTTGTFGGADVALKARGSHKSDAKATSKQEAGGDSGSSVGIGASVALSLITNEIFAGVGDRRRRRPASPTCSSRRPASTTRRPRPSGGAAGGTSASLTGVASVAIHNVHTRAVDPRGSQPSRHAVASPGTRTRPAKATTKRRGRDRRPAAARHSRRRSRSR